jgi:hypothetical protein
VFRQADKRRALAKEVVCGLGSTVADSTLCNEVFCIEIGEMVLLGTQWMQKMGNGCGDCPTLDGHILWV